MISLTDTPKKSEKSRKKIQAKAIQGHVPWLNAKKMFQVSFSQCADNVETPFVQIHMPGSNTHALNQPGGGGVPK